eukprot:1133151-Pelagomonas_calceolata.AAC.11
MERHWLLEPMRYFIHHQQAALGHLGNSESCCFQWHVWLAYGQYRSSHPNPGGCVESDFGTLKLFAQLTVLSL